MFEPGRDISHPEPDPTACPWQVHAFGLRPDASVGRIPISHFTVVSAWGAPILTTPIKKMPETKQTLRAPTSPIGLDDPELHSRIQTGEPQALRAVVHAYLGQILRAARGAGPARDLQLHTEHPSTIHT